ncbi:MAG: hypothetical protein LLG00_11600 [Planctomycetaceae bacterium]|nr:hypothetical protein [Planctomycetaceae bacterium]
MKRKHSPYLAAFRYFLQRHPRCFAVWRLALTLTGRVALFWRRPQLTETQIRAVFNAVQPGDVIGVKSRRFLTGLLLPLGKYDVEHSAIYTGAGVVVEAVTPCVREISLYDFLAAYDRAVVIRLMSDWSVSARVAACNEARRLVGRSYDVLFDDGTRSTYCHETCAVCMKAAGLRLKRAGQFWEFDDLAAVCDIVLEIGK